MQSEELEKAFDEIEQDPQLQDEFNNILRYPVRLY
jgi:hypothetical protein